VLNLRWYTYHVNVYYKLNDNVNVYGGNDECRCQEIKTQPNQSVAQREIFAT